MKVVMEYFLKFGFDLQQDIDKWVQWVEDEVEKWLVEFFLLLLGEMVQNYLWVYMVVCLSCQLVVFLSLNWWLYKCLEKQNLYKWCVVKFIFNFEGKWVDFELIKGSKGKGMIIKIDEGEFDLSDYNIISRGVGKCLNCGNVIEDGVIKFQVWLGKFGY